MNLRVIVRTFWALPALVCVLILQSLDAQQMAPSTSSERAAGSGSAVSSGQRNGVQGGSTWGAGKSNFGSSPQPGGVWRDGSTLNSSPVPSRTNAKFPAFEPNPAPAQTTLGGGALGRKQVNIRGISTLGTANSSSASSSRHPSKISYGSGAGPKFSGSKLTFGKSINRTGSSGRKVGNSDNRQSSGLSSTFTQSPVKSGFGVPSAPRGSLDPGLTRGDLKPLH